MAESDHLIKEIMMKSRPAFPVVVSGPSGVGKTSLVQSALAQHPDWCGSISVTTRSVRPGEIAGKSYEFVTKDEFLRTHAAGGFVETAEVHENLYGTPKARLEGWIREGHVVVLNLDVQGGASMRLAYPDGVFVFILPPDLATLEARLRRRGTDSAEIVGLRLENARKELQQASNYSYIIVNESLEAATRQLVSIIEAEQCRVDRRLGTQQK